MHKIIDIRHIVLAISENQRYNQYVVIKFKSN